MVGKIFINFLTCHRFFLFHVILLLTTYEVIILFFGLRMNFFALRKNDFPHCSLSTDRDDDKLYHNFNNGYVNLFPFVNLRILNLSFSILIKINILF